MCMLDVKFIAYQSISALRSDARSEFGKSTGLNRDAWRLMMCSLALDPFRNSAPAPLLYESFLIRRRDIPDTNRLLMELVDKQFHLRGFGPGTVLTPGSDVTVVAPPYIRPMRASNFQPYAIPLPLSGELSSQTHRWPYLPSVSASR